MMGNGFTRSIVRTIVALGFTLVVLAAASVVPAQDLDAGKDLMIRGADSMREGMGELIGDLVKKGVIKEGVHFEGQKMINGGHTLVMRAANLWLPTGDNILQARQMMLQGSQLMLNGNTRLKEELDRNGILKQATAMPGASRMNSGEDALKKAEIILKK